MARPGTDRAPKPQQHQAGFLEAGPAAVVSDCAESAVVDKGCVDS